MGPTVEQNFARNPSSGKEHIMGSLWYAKRVVVKTSRILEKIRPSLTKKNNTSKIIIGPGLLLGPDKN